MSLGLTGKSIDLRQAQAGTLANRLRRKEGLEDARLDLRRPADPDSFFVVSGDRTVTGKP